MRNPSQIALPWQRKPVLYALRLVLIWSAGIGWLADREIVHHRDCSIMHLCNAPGYCRLLTLPTNINLGGKHSCLLQKLLNYGRKGFTVLDSGQEGLVLSLPLLWLQLWLQPSFAPKQTGKDTSPLFCKKCNKMWMRQSGATTFSLTTLSQTTLDCRICREYVYLSYSDCHYIEFHYSDWNYAEYSYS
jgi:hypothetical protein